MNPEFVLDCSVAMAWLFEDEQDDYADAVQARLTQSPACVPVLWHYKVANLLVLAQRRRRLTAAKANQYARLLMRLPIVTDDQPPAATNAALMRMATKHGLTAYDAAYLELCARTGLPLATLDRSLQRAARAAHIGLFKPAR